MSRPPTVREREHARQRAQQAARQQQDILARRRRKVLALVGAVLALALVAGFFGVRTGDEEGAAAPTTTSPTTTVPATGSAQLTFPPPGEVLTTETPCPAEDGSSPRVTTFAGPPPMCIDPSLSYEAIIRTSKGDLTLLLNPAQAPQAVNNFVVLSRYHYYDGQPFTSIRSRESAFVAGRFEGVEGRPGPGYALAGEVEPVIWVTGQIGMVPNGPDSTEYGASFLIATFELAAGLPESLTQFGLMLDGHQTLIAIERAGSESGRPVEEVTIESISTRALPDD
jgi:cyclophilin family peptidyl-prolyl cis-trans isomerase